MRDVCKLKSSLLGNFQKLKELTSVFANLDKNSFEYDEFVFALSTSWSSARPPVAADTPKKPFLGSTTFSARMHISKS